MKKTKINLEKEILEKDTPYIKATVNAYIHDKYADRKMPSVFDREDMYQEAYIAYLNAIRHHDGEKAQLKTYGSHAIRNALNKSYRKYDDVLRQSYLEDMLFKEEGQESELLEDLEVGMWVESVAKELLDKKDSKKYMEIGITAILQMGLFETPQTDIAKHYGVSKEYVNKCINKARNKLQEDERFMELVSEL